MRLGYQDRITGTGVVQALDDIGRVLEKRYNADLTYQKNGLLPSFDLAVSANIFQQEQPAGKPAFTLLPAGTLGGAFPNGLIGNPGHSERNASFAVTGTHFPSHKIRAGVAIELKIYTKLKNLKILPMSMAG